MIPEVQAVANRDTRKSWHAFQKLICFTCATIFVVAPLSGVIERGDSAARIREFEVALDGYLRAASDGKFADIPDSDRYSIRIQTVFGLVDPILRLEKAGTALKDWKNRERARALISRGVWNYNLTNSTAAKRAANWKDSDFTPYTPTRSDIAKWDHDARNEASDRALIEQGWRRSSTLQVVAIASGVVILGGTIGWYFGWLLTFVSFLVWQFVLDRLRDLIGALKRS